VLCHNVYFQLKDPSPQSIERLIEACRKHLTGHPGTVSFACGTLAEPLARPVNVRDWHVALHILFTDQAAHDTYQAHPRHEQFVTEQKPGWASARVFDSVVETHST
jgi:quinol monooxygenase YgiN